MKKNKRQRLYKRLDDAQRELLFKEWGKQCVLCGSTNKVGTGHVFSRRHLNTRWDYEPGGNAYPQCWGCNYKHVRDQYPYFKWFEDMYGADTFEKLRKRWNTVKQMKIHDLEALLEDMRNNND